MIISGRNNQQKSNLSPKRCSYFRSKLPNFVWSCRYFLEGKHKCPSQFELCVGHVWPLIPFFKQKHTAWIIKEQFIGSLSLSVIYFKKRQARVHCRKWNQKRSKKNERFVGKTWLKNLSQYYSLFFRCIWDYQSVW